MRGWKWGSLVALSVLAASGVWASFSLAPNVWSAAVFEAQQPLGSDPINQVDDHLRVLKEEVRRRADVEHHWGTVSDADDDGLHRLGSARCFYASSAPTVLDGGAVTYDNTAIPGSASGTLSDNNPAGAEVLGLGRCWIDTDGGDMYVYDGTQWVLQRPLPPNHLSGNGITYTNGTTMVVAAGWARDSTDVSNIRLAAGLSKVTGAGANWVAGAAAQANPDPLTNSTWYAVHLLSNPDGVTVDWGLDIDTAASNLLGDANVVAAGHTLYRRVGWVYVGSGGALEEWVQQGDEFYWPDPLLGNDDAAPVDYTAGVWVPLTHSPRGVMAHINYMFHDLTGLGHSALMGRTTSLGTPADATGAGTWGSPGHQVRVGGGELDLTGAITLWADDNGVDGDPGRVRVRVRIDTTTTFQAAVEGWRDTRGKDS
jgi:hypothetical protein